MTDDKMDIGHDFNNDGGRYWAKVEGGSAELTYRNRGVGVIVIDHTFTPPQARGRGVAEALVARIVADARERGLKIVPECPYAARLFSERPEWRDVLADDEFGLRSKTPPPAGPSSLRRRP